MTAPGDPLLDADDVGAMLAIPAKRVYELPIPKVRIGTRTVRWQLADVQAYLDSVTDKPTKHLAGGPSTADWAKPATTPRDWRPTRPSPQPSSHTQTTLYPEVDEYGGFEF